MKILEVSNRDAGQRLDKFLLKFLNQAPQSFVYKMLRKKNIVLNDNKADGSEKIKENDQIKLYLSDETITKFIKPLKKRLDMAGRMSLDNIYEDEDVIIVNKPVGILSQKAEDTDISMNEYLISYLLVSGALAEEDLSTFHPAVCNRLDRNTSGILLAGKTMKGLQGLSQMLKNRSLKKYYLCLAVGNIKKGALIKGYLKKDKKNNTVTITSTKGESDSYIETAYEPLSSNNKVTLLQVELITGRTHQIRSHLASIGHAIVGDGKYGDKITNELFKEKYKLRHQLLHAWYICFANDETNGIEGLAGRRFVATPPKQFENIVKMEQLEEYNEKRDFA